MHRHGNKEKKSNADNLIRQTIVAADVKQTVAVNVISFKRRCFPGGYGLFVVDGGRAHVMCAVTGRFKAGRPIQLFVIQKKDVAHAADFHNQLHRHHHGGAVWQIRFAYLVKFAVVCLIKANVVAATRQRMKAHGAGVLDGIWLVVKFYFGTGNGA